MLIEAFRMMFGGTHAGRGRGVGWWCVLACGAGFVALAAWAGSGAFEGSYPWSQGRVFLTVVAGWAGALFLRTRWDAKPAMPRVLAFGVRWFNHLLTLTLLYVPGLAVLWYSLEAADQPSLNSRGQDVCATEAAQYCVSGPRALVPWAIILLVFAAFVTWGFIWKWSTNGGRKSRLVKPVYDIAASVRRVESVIPPNDPGSESSGPEATPPNGAERFARRIAIGSLVNTLSAITAGGSSAPAPTSRPAPGPEPAEPQEWPPRRAPERELNAFANIPRPDGPGPGQPRRDAKLDHVPTEPAEPTPAQSPLEAVHALGELVKMHRAGDISDAEFDALKSRLIGGTADAG